MRCGAIWVYKLPLLHPLDQSVLRVLTVFSVILLPLTLIASIFGMNVKVPGQGSISGFWIVVVAMVAVLGAMIAEFRRRGLL